MKSNCAGFQPSEAENAIPQDTVAFEGTVREDSPRASQSPVPEEARELLCQSHSENGARDEEHTRDEEKDAEEQTLLDTDAVDPTEIQHLSGLASSKSETEGSRHIDTTAAGQKNEATSIDSIDTSPTASSKPLAIEDARPASPPSENDEAVRTSMDTMPMNSHVNPEQFKPLSPLAESEISRLATSSPLTGSLKLLRPEQTLDMNSPGASSPQIGTSLLRRESLRNRDTPSKKKEPIKVRSPRKRDTLSRRDTLQEREILQRIIAETNQTSHPKDVDGTNRGVIAASESLSGGDSRNTNQSEEAVRLESAIVADQPSERTASDVECVRPDPDDASVEKDLHRAIEAIEVFEQPMHNEIATLDLSNQPLLSEETGSRADLPADQSEELENINKANEIIAEAELEEAMQSAEGVKEQTESPHRKTRSGIRFSDDTSMLRDFLNRAQASKAAKTPIIPPLDAPKPQISPRRSPRKAHRLHNSTSSTPQQLILAANRPGTPPEITRPDTLESDNAEEITATPTSCRRSTRTRLPAPAKAPPGAPSFIPVKRADGSDPVVLQKSQAQELAMVTRANTRRNKGQSKPPLLALQEIPADASQTVGAKQRGDSGKAVGWAEKLASYHDAKGKSNEAEELKPKVRRMRGLGAANGTPAPKKTVAMVDTSNGIPAPKRRGRATPGK